MPHNTHWDMSISQISDMIRGAGLRPTKQRLALGRFLWIDVPNQHVTAESLHQKTQEEGDTVSLATVYNTLHQFNEAGLIREIVIDSQRSYFDTHVEHHHHFYCEDTGALIDIPKDAVDVSKIPTPPEGAEITDVDVVIRLRKCNAAEGGFVTQ